MAVFVPPIKPGDVIANNELAAMFKVSNMSGMRRSHSTGTLVIISDHTKGLYDDKWYGDELHYTGMGKTGDQVLSGNQNKTLAESDRNGVEVHLFEVLKATEYIYRGVVHLCGAPYQEQQKDDNGNDRLVWMFPVKPEQQTTLSEEALHSYVDTQEKKAKALSFELLKEKATEHASQNAAHREVTTNTFIRDPYISEYAKKRANGQCQLCGKQAPFLDKKGVPYLESHHIIWLSKGGDDSIENTVALCPNCHRKMHIVNSEEDRIALQNKAQE